MKNIITTIALVCLTIFSFGQDKIVKRDLVEILCKVSEIGTTEIKYKKADNLEGPTYTIKKSEVLKIVFENGTEEKFETNEMSVVPSQNRNAKRAITTRPFSPLSGHLCVGYQHALHPSRALIAELGWIGPRIGDGQSASGAYGRVGFRLKRSPEVVMEGMEWGYNLGGVYVQPEICYSNFSGVYTSYDWNTGVTTTERKNRYSGAFLITVGRQVILGELMTFDLAGSIGYGFNSDNGSGLWDFDPRYYSHANFGDSTPIAFNLTFSMGFLLK